MNNISFPSFLNKLKKFYWTDGADKNYFFHTILFSDLLIPNVLQILSNCMYPDGRTNKVVCMNYCVIVDFDRCGLDRKLFSDHFFRRTILVGNLNSIWNDNLWTRQNKVYCSQREWDFVSVKTYGLGSNMNDNYWWELFVCILLYLNQNTVDIYIISKKKWISIHSPEKDIWMISILGNKNSTLLL